MVFNAVGIDGLLHPPKSMWDAYGQQMITPLVALAQADLRLFEEVDNKGPNKARLLKVPFDIPEKYMAEALTWSRTTSSACSLSVMRPARSSFSVTV